VVILTKAKRYIIAISLICILCYAAVYANSYFTDIPEDYWAKEYIEYLAPKTPILDGSNLFGPEDIMTSAEFVCLVLKMYKYDLVDYDICFNDITGSEWFDRYVITAKKLGIVYGDENNNFNPEQNITREEMIAILMRA
jgi:hypothetical protein